MFLAGSFLDRTPLTMVVFSAAAVPALPKIEVAGRVLEAAGSPVPRGAPFAADL
jgi:hypothetical protein